MEHVRFTMAAEMQPSGLPVSNADAPPLAFVPNQRVARFGFVKRVDETHGTV